MHRTEGDGYELEGLFRRYINQGIPIEEGTVLVDDHLNAIQEELCNLVTLSGGTLNGGGDNGTSAADRSAGWHQCYDAIFQAGHMTDAGIDGITFAKISGTINLVSGGSEWLQDVTGCTYTTGSGAYSDLDADNITFVGATSSNQALLSPVTGLSIGALNITTKHFAQGLQYTDGPGDVSAFKAAKIRKSAFALTGISWSQIGTTNIYNATINYDTDIPDTVGLNDFYSARFIADDSTIVQVNATSILAQVITGFYRINNLKSVGWASAPPTSGTLVIEYDASSL